MFGFNVDAEDVKALVVAFVVTSVCVAAFYRRLELYTILSSIAAAFLAVASRELAQRYASHLMHAYQDTSLRPRGSFLSLGTAVAALLVNAPIALIIPLSSSFEQKDYEQWGYSVDVVWPKREYWIAGAGVAATLVTWISVYLLGFQDVATGIGLFAVSQMIPLNEPDFFQGKTDGAYVLLHSGYVYLLLAGLSMIAAVLPVAL